MGSRGPWRSTAGQLGGGRVRGGGGGLGGRAARVGRSNPSVRRIGPPIGPRGRGLAGRRRLRRCGGGSRAGSCELAPEAVEGSGGAGLDGAAADAEGGGGLGLAEVGEVAEPEDLAVAVVEGGEGGAQLGVTLAAERQRLRGRRWRIARRRGAGALAELPAAGRAAGAVAGLVGDDRQQPGAQRGAGPEAAERRVGLDE